MIRKSDYGVYFISDWHQGHKNILKHQKNRIPLIEQFMKEKELDCSIEEAHDLWLEDIWLNTTKRGDHVYVLGDFIMSNQQEAIKILHKLKSKGCRIHLIIGNHDKSTQRMFNMYDTIDMIKVLNFKKSVFPFIEEENFQCICCHYPMKSWFNKCRGSLHLYGHVHDNSPWIEDGLDLTINVGFDTPLANMGLIPIEDIYKVYKEKLNGIAPKDYVDWASKQDPKFIR